MAASVARLRPRATLGVTGEGEHARRHSSRGDLARDVEPIAVRQVAIENDHIRMHPSEEGEGFVHARGLVHDEPRPAERSAVKRPDLGTVVDEKDESGARSEA